MTPVDPKTRSLQYGMVALVLLVASIATFAWDFTRTTPLRAHRITATVTGIDPVRTIQDRGGFSTSQNVHLHLPDGRTDWFLLRDEQIGQVNARVGGPATVYEDLNTPRADRTLALRPGDLPADPDPTITHWWLWLSLFALTLAMFTLAIFKDQEGDPAEAEDDLTP